MTSSTIRYIYIIVYGLVWIWAVTGLDNEAKPKEDSPLGLVRGKAP